LQLQCRFFNVPTQLVEEGTVCAPTNSIFFLTETLSLYFLGYSLPHDP
jgi:hypothetical protein